MSSSTVMSLLDELKDESKQLVDLVSDLKSMKDGSTAPIKIDHKGIFWMLTKKGSVVKSLAGAADDDLKFIKRHIQLSKIFIGKVEASSNQKSSLPKASFAYGELDGLELLGNATVTIDETGVDIVHDLRSKVRDDNRTDKKGQKVNSLALGAGLGLGLLLLGGPTLGVIGALAGSAIGLAKSETPVEQGLKTTSSNRPTDVIRFAETIVELSKVASGYEDVEKHGNSSMSKIDEKNRDARSLIVKTVNLNCVSGIEHALNLTKATQALVKKVISAIE